MAAALYDRQGDLGRIPWKNFAEESGVPDLGRFEECTRSGRHRQRVERDAAVGDSIGILGTPTLIVNGLVLTGAIRVQDLAYHVQVALKKPRTH
jgi:protein-disulfide isomerase